MLFDTRLAWLAKGERPPQTAQSSGDSHNVSLCLPASGESRSGVCEAASAAKMSINLYGVVAMVSGEYTAGWIANQIF
jgi:hypothetical protein